MIGMKIASSKKVALFGVALLVSQLSLQRLSFEPCYVLQVGLDSPLKLVSVL